MTKPGDRSYCNIGIWPDMMDLVAASRAACARHLGVDLVHMSAPFCNHTQAGAFPWQSSARPDDTISLRSKNLLANAIVSARAMNAKIQMVMVGMGGISARSQRGKVTAGREPQGHQERVRWRQPKFQSVSCRPNRAPKCLRHCRWHARSFLRMLMNHHQT